MAADVARSPSQSSTGTGSTQVGGNGGGGGGSAVVAVHSSRSKSPFHFNSPSSSSLTRAPSQTSVSSPQQYQTQSQSQSQSHYRPASPSEEVSNSSSSFFSHQRLSPSGRNTRLPSSASERTVPRGLPPMSLPVGEGGVMGGLGPNDPRLPMSPGDGTLGMSDIPDGLTGDPTAPRKRSKVSRACDECRRKKVGWSAAAGHFPAVSSVVIARALLCLFVAGRWVDVVLTFVDTCRFDATRPPSLVSNSVPAASALALNAPSAEYP
jgi:hypothetical protein